MAGIFKIRELEARKRAVIEQSELYRQSLRFEIDNLRLHATSIRRKATWLTLTPLWPLVPSLLTAFVKKRRPTSNTKFRWLSAALAGWQLYQKVARFMPGIFSRSRRARVRDEHVEGRI
jgi:hypothetical protein